MWPFKKIPKIETLNSTESLWNVYQAKQKDSLMIIRVNDSATAWVKHPELSTRVGFAIPLNTKSTTGLPDPAENLVLNEIEDGLYELLQKSGYCLQVLAISTATFKEFVFYINNLSSIEAVHKEAIEKFPSHEIQCIAEHDPNWKVYCQYSKA